MPSALLFKAKRKQVKRFQWIVKFNNYLETNVFEHCISDS